VNAAAPDTAVATRAGATPETGGADAFRTLLTCTTGAAGMPFTIAGVCARVSRAIAASPVAFGCTGKALTGATAGSNQRVPIGLQAS